MARRPWKYWTPTFQADAVCPLNPVWPWGGHRRFAYDLVRWMRPARIAELGVHWGTSFFTFAQAVKDGRMAATELVGVDTFEGEDHAGHYGPEVYDAVQRIVRECFAKQSITLHKSLFRDALPHVADESVDLLHIDGLHTFEAVKDDFESWLPKLAAEGVVMFHDVAPGTGYGSADYWKALTAAHPGFAFEHSWGLGVLFPKGDARLRELRTLGLDDKILAYTHLARSERADHEVRDLTRMVEERAETIRKQSEVVRQREQTLEHLRTDHAESAKKHAEQIRHRDASIERLTERLETSKKAVEERAENLRAALGRAAESERLSAKLETRLAAAETARDELRARVEDLRSRIEDFRTRVHQQDERLASERDTRKRLQERIEEAAQQAAKLREKVAADEAARAAADEHLAQITEHLAALAASHDRGRKSNDEQLTAIGGALEQARRSAEAAAAALAKRLARLDTDTELLSLRAEHVEEVVSEQRARLDELAPRPVEDEDWLTGARAAAQGRRPRTP